MLNSQNRSPGHSLRLALRLLMLGLCFLGSGCLKETGLISKQRMEAFVESLGPQALPVLVEEGFAEVQLRDEDQTTLGRLQVTDLSVDPEALALYTNGKIRVAGYQAHSATNLGNETNVLVSDRFQIKLRSENEAFDEAARIQWLESNAMTLGKLARTTGPSVAWLVSVLGVSVVFLLVLILVFKMQAFLALLIASIIVGIGAGMDLMEVVQSVIDGMGGSLGFIATIIGLGAILGKVLEFSGGAESLAHSLIKAFGEKRVSWAMVLTGFLISIPVFFDVGLVIVISILYAMARDTKKSLLYFGLPLTAGMATTHAFIPPTPGPILVAGNLGVGLGWVILFGFIVGLPTAIIAGPWIGCKLAEKHFVPVPDISRLGLENQREGTAMELPSLGMILLIIGLPITMILGGTVLDLLVDQGRLGSNTAVTVFIFLGHPIIALIIATLLSLYLLGTRRGVSRSKLMELSTASLAPAGIIILVTGAGGVFKQMLGDSGVGQTLADLIASSSLSTLVLAYLFAVIVRVTQGSATVSMIAASSLIAPVVEAANLGEMHKALVVISIAAGATILSHVNDSGFWIVNRYFGMTEKQTLQTWTVVTTVISVVGFFIAWLLSLVI